MGLEKIINSIYTRVKADDLLLLSVKWYKNHSKSFAGRAGQLPFAANHKNCLLLKETILNNNSSIRNIAIIAHVDHGKTTLVDAMFQQSGLFRDNQDIEDRVMDNMDLERERGITITAKNCSVNWKGTKINIIDTPGHADFGGEVERGLSMADGAILLVDASEGPLPQTRFVLEKALKKGLKIMVVINKIDRQDARTAAVLDEVYSLLIDLDANDEQMEFPLLYAIGRDGLAMEKPDDVVENLHILLDLIVDEVSPPVGDPDVPFQMLVSDLGYSDYLGRLAIGKVVNGSASSRDSLFCLGDKGSRKELKVSKLQVYEGISLAETTRVLPGDIVVLSGIEDVSIGDTICTDRNADPLPRIKVDEPTVFMKFARNSSPNAGKDGKLVQSSKIRERLIKESLLNVSVQVEEAEDKDSFIVKGRGEFQMAILVETMRREGFELCIGRPHVIFKTIDGVRHEPIENLLIDCSDEYSNVVMDKLLQKKCLLTNMMHRDGGRVNLEFSAPSRSLIGYRDEFLTDTRGTGIINSSFHGYEPFRGDFPHRNSGSLVADRPGKAVPYALFNLEARGKLFVKPGDDIYEGMIVGEHTRDNDLNVNPSKPKKLSNMRASGKDEAVILTTVVPMTLEKAIQFIREDELVEVTPKIIRVRKAALGAQERKVLEKRLQ
ncbi:MAG: translational GTPase TypA [Spirochaetales bacterium]|nr:translational GTPase TypA [Spirochaetales bacterium]